MSSIIISLLLIGVLVVVHEFGHFFVAKKSGIRVEEFAIGMGQKIFSIKKGDTEYSLRLFPFGGFCRMEGESRDGTYSETSFFSKPIHIRLMVMAAGPFMNFLLAMVFIFILTSATFIFTPEVSKVIENSPAQEIGLQEGDIIRQINGKRIYIFENMQTVMAKVGGEPIELEIVRDGQKLTFDMMPMYSEVSRQYLVGFETTRYLGIFADPIEGFEKLSIFETIEYSFYSMIYYVQITAEGLTRIFTFTASQDEYGGPIAIVQVVGQGFEAGLEESLRAALLNIVYIGAVLSANLGVLNLFPIPALDGGRIVFLLIEAIRRKPMNPEWEGRIQFAGFAFLMGLMVYILYGDIVKILL